VLEELVQLQFHQVTQFYLHLAVVGAVELLRSQAIEGQVEAVAVQVE
jgi:hypothetical protein